MQRIWHDHRMRKQRRLEDAYRFIGFRPEHTVRGIFGDPMARIVRLLRRGKKRPVDRVDGGSEPFTTARPVGCATSLVATLGCTWSSGPAHTFSLMEKTLRNQAETPKKAQITGVRTRRRSGRAANTVLPEQSPNHRKTLESTLVRRGRSSEAL